MGDFRMAKALTIRPSTRKQSGLFDEKPYIGPKTSAEDQRRWRDRNREHVKEQSRLRAKRRKHNGYMEKWRKDNRDKISATDRKRRLKKYGLSVADYERMVIAQGNCCAICARAAAQLKRKNSKSKHHRLDIDHCHVTGKVRSLLCYNCNAILGHAKDSIAVLLKAIAYLRQNGVEG
jgi:hypothetical protein